MTMTMPRRVLAIYPTSRGLGYVVLELPTNIIGWGVKATREIKKKQTLARLADLIRDYQPDILVLEDARDSQRCPRVRDLLETVCTVAKKQKLKTRKFSIQRARKVFAAFGANTKHQIAQVIAQQLPALAPWLPRQRKPWESEDYQMGVFDAATLALTYSYSLAGRSQSQ